LETADELIEGCFLKFFLYWAPEHQVRNHNEHGCDEVAPTDVFSTRRIILTWAVGQVVKESSEIIAK